MTAPLRIAVTGASGNVGTALLRTLAETARDWQILAICRRPPAPGDPEYDRVEWVECDVSRRDAEASLKHAFRDADAVVHLAWRIQPNHDQDLLWRTNVDGSRRVFAAAAEAGVPHLVYASSLAAYSAAPKNRPVDESWPTEGIPTSYYSVHKAAVERALDTLQRRAGAPAVARIRPALVFQRDAGSAIARYFFGPLVPKRVAGLRRTPILPVPDLAVFQCVHALDVADALWRILARRATGPFNLAATPVLTPRELAGVFRARRGTLSEPFLRRAVELTWRLRLQPSDPGWVDLTAAVPIMSTGRAREELGWYARHDARQVVAELFDGIRDGAGTRSPALASRATVTSPLPQHRRPVLSSRGHGP